MIKKLKSSHFQDQYSFVIDIYIDQYLIDFSLRYRSNLVWFWLVFRPIFDLNSIYFFDFTILGFRYFFDQIFDNLSGLLAGKITIKG